MKRRGYSIYRKRRDGKYVGSWYVAWTDGTGKRCVEKASLDKGIAQEIGRAKAAEADRVRGGVVDQVVNAAKNAASLSIKVHLEAWKDSLESQKRTPRYVKMEHWRVTTLFETAGIQSLSDMTREKVQSTLGRIAESGTPQTANHYRVAARMFSRWCAESDRTTADKLFGVGRVAAHGETFKRTPITAETLAKLLDVTATRKCRSPVNGPDRAMYYRIMAYTGFRKSETLSLTLESFDLSLDAPSITVEAGYSKRRRKDVQLITESLVDALIPWLAGKQAKKPIFPFPPHWNLERIFRADCKAAGINEVEGERLGVHSFRRFYITAVVRAGGLAVGQDMARHSTPALTKKYTDLEVADMQRGLAGLPPVKKIEATKNTNKKAG